MQHQKLVEFLDQEAIKRRLTPTELSRKIGLNENQLGNIMRGTVPGLKVCRQIARAFDVKPDYILYLAGHIEEDELTAPSEIPTELVPSLRRLSNLKGTPFFDTAVDLAEGAIEGIIKLFKVAA